MPQGVGIDDPSRLQGGRGAGADQRRRVVDGATASIDRLIANRSGLTPLLPERGAVRVHSDRARIQDEATARVDQGPMLASSSPSKPIKPAMLSSAPVVRASVPPLARQP